MTTYNITSNLLNTTSRNLWIVARNSSSTPAPAWFAWAVALVTIAIVILGAVVLYDICKDSIEYFFWDLKYRKK